MASGPGMLLAADNINALNPPVAAALQDLAKKPIQELVRRLDQAGVDLIDLNPGYLPPRREDRMVFLVEAVQDVSSTRLILDSPNPRVLAKGLAVCQRPPILNALTLEEEKLTALLPLAVQAQTDLVLLLLDEHSRPAPRLEEKLLLAHRLREAALAAGLSPEQLIFDPVLPNLSWPDVYYQTSADIKAIRLLAAGAVFGEPARTMIGLSNLRSGQRQLYPLELEVACLGLLAGAGVDILLLDILQPELLAHLHRVQQLWREP
ncbi:MAG: dihydropteroate synthase [Desulfobacca sp.]|uniref:dihydropteroate synthase n=1 Tax=Desulfobacca sp. TaxID=2067990 RepID=UPI00404B6115